MVRDKVVSIVGARPNFVKLAALTPYLDKHFEHIIVHTGQHYDYELSKIFFEQLNIPEPHYFLGVGSGTHGYQIGEMIKRCENVLMKEKPRLVIVYGDTNSTLAGALAAAKLKILVAHVEAGLRCGDKRLTEEVNRIVVDHLSDFLFAPTKTAVTNLMREGITEGVFLTGDVMLDLFLKVRDKIRLRHTNEDYILVTVHRAENVDDPHRLRRILEALVESGERIVFPMHPRTKKRVKEFRLTSLLKKGNIEVLPPLGYLDFLKLMSKAKKVVTDSGGVQKEAYFLGKPCITLRETTEWIETVRYGWNILVGVDKRKIVQAIKSFQPSGPRPLSVFGDGRASKRIVDILYRCLG